MGRSTHGYLFYGIVFEEGAELPWDDLDDWWLARTGFKPTFYPFTEAGEFKEGVEGRQVDEYFQELQDWRDAHPCPITLINYCSNEVPMWAIAIPESLQVALRGDPTIVNPYKVTDDAKWADDLYDFCAQYGLPFDGHRGPEWWVASYAD